MAVNIDIQNASASSPVPSLTQLQQWAQVALENNNAELALRIVDEAEGKQLNKQWRNQDKATNVLSFPVGEKLEHAPELLGDIVICAPIVEQEAIAQEKTLDAHWAHLLIHGILHLQGFDHQLEEEARIMEENEIRLLNKMGYANPYQGED